MVDSLGTQVFSVESMGFVEGFVSFRSLCGVQSSPLRCARNRAAPLSYRVLRYRCRHGERPNLLVLAKYSSPTKRFLQLL